MSWLVTDLLSVCVAESSLSGKTHPSTPAMYKFRPSFGTMPKVHYHTAGEKVRPDQFRCTLHVVSSPPGFISSTIRS